MGIDLVAVHHLRNFHFGSANDKIETIFLLLFYLTRFPKKGDSSRFKAQSSPEMMVLVTEYYPFAMNNRHSCSLGRADLVVVIN